MSLDREEPNYFGAGPALLPTSVLQQAAKDLINYDNIGIGAGEISHRSKAGTSIIDQTKNSIKELLNVPDTHEVFFLQGGGTTGFSSIVANLSAAYIKKHQKIGTPYYVIDGTWSKKSFEEAERLGFNPKVIVNSKEIDGKFGTIPSVDKWNIPKNLDDISFIYYCDNETVNGVEFREFPFDKFPNVEIVADMSSNFLSKPVDVSKYGLIFAGAQKNVGVSGVSIYIIKKSLLQQASADELKKLGQHVVPIAFDYPTVVNNNSAYNTIPTFTVHIVNLVLKNLIEKGGLKAQEAENIEKSNLLYSILDKYPTVFNMPVEKSARSRMNIVFTIKDGSLDNEFIKEAENAKLSGLKGHRSVGGMRASLYNAVTLKSTKLLCEFVEDFAKKHQ
ncbi:Phosphoserine transaminase [Pichia californica]|uniref:Phosphoserine aminotransferase n=1 Tax=Pichia californica TaxID=460514 RepID=A0A9P7BEE5_9ASCO|nr:Phosphoserine transaminase [[Candida] californica]KAG0687020.1 Phosphoserine transaminase [[Candida] californica]